jgi:uncharacterized protein YndB with AHSA1/START domain
MNATDRIEKTIVLRAPLARVWRAVADAKEFGSWFGVAFTGPFSPGSRLEGKITSPPEYAGFTFEVDVDRIEPMRLFSFRWHPYAVERGRDYSKEPTTLVVFELEEVPEGTRLKVVESGFDRIPPERRAMAFRMNDQGWTAQMKAIEKYLGAAR